MVDIAVSFGPIITAGDVRDAVHDTISFWSRTYLDGMARHDGQAALQADGSHTLPDFRSYPDSIDTSTFPEDQLPACTLVVPGITQRPEKRGSGKVWAQWAVGVGLVVSGPNRQRTIRLAQLYTAAVRAILLQHPSLKGSGATPFASGVVWLGERYTDPAPRGSERTIMAGMLQFGVDVDGVVFTTEGPTTPITDGTVPTGWPTVATPEMAVTGYPSDEEIPQ